jgi:hypothetical protein
MHVAIIGDGAILQYVLHLRLSVPQTELLQSLGEVLRRQKSAVVAVILPKLLACRAGQVLWVVAKACRVYPVIELAHAWGVIEVSHG